MITLSPGTDRWSILMGVFLKLLVWPKVAFCLLKCTQVTRSSWWIYESLSSIKVYFWSRFKVRTISGSCPPPLTYNEKCFMQNKLDNTLDDAFPKESLWTLFSLILFKIDMFLPFRSTHFTCTPIFLWRTQRKYLVIYVFCNFPEKFSEALG